MSLFFGSGPWGQSGVSEPSPTQRNHGKLSSRQQRLWTTHCHRWGHGCTALVHTTDDSSSWWVCVCLCLCRSRFGRLDDSESGQIQTHRGVFGHPAHWPGFMYKWYGQLLTGQYRWQQSFLYDILEISPAYCSHTVHKHCKHFLCFSKGRTPCV